LQPQVAQQVLSDRSAMQKAMVQLKVADQVTAMLRRFVPSAQQEEESENLANAS